MKGFFGSISFKIIAGIVALLCGTMLYFATSGSEEIAPNSLAGAVITPIEQVASKVSGAVADFFGKLIHIGEISDENAELKKEIDDLRRQMLDYNDFKSENEQLRDFLGIKQKNEDFEMQPALIIGRSTENKNSVFTIDKGTSDGICAGDPVITSSGLCGIVTGVALTYSRVTTVISGKISVGAVNSDTGEAGVLTSDEILSEKKLCKLTMLSRDTVTDSGDIIITSGTGGVYPKGLVIGTVNEVTPDDSGLSYRAQVEPCVDMENITAVAVITDFIGQGIEIEE